MSTHDRPRSGPDTQPDPHLVHDNTHSSFPDEIATWPTITEPMLVEWTTPSVDVLVVVMPGEDITAALIAAARDEIELYAPVNLEEFDVTITPDRLAD